MISRQASKQLRCGFATVQRTSSLTATPFSAKFGAEICGIDFTKPIPRNIAADVVDMMNKYGVCVFRNTGLTDKTHVEFSKNFGDLEVAHGLNKPRRASLPQLYDAGNLTPDDKIIEKFSRAWWHTKGNGLWHTDSSFNQHRASYSALRAVELPPSGGQTMYCDVRTAYDDLPADAKELIEDRVVEHWIWHSRRIAAPTEFDQPTQEERVAKPPAYHRLVQWAPGGHCKTLYIASHAKRIIGMPEKDGVDLINSLLDHCAQDKYIMGIQWKNIGDIVQWDNRCTMHRATAFNDQTNRRDMRRTTVYDNGDNAFGVKDRLDASQIDVMSGGKRETFARA